MRLEKLFERNINRSINGVVKVNQDNDAIVYQELDEYVVTKELLTHFRNFFDKYRASVSSETDKMGVWVSGFFGSGKSHFIKILSYLLQNLQVNNNGTERNALSFFEDKILDASVMADLKTSITGDTDILLFNIDSKADSKDKENAILKVFMKVFNEMQGFCGEIPELAEVERYLVRKGLYEEFKLQIKDLSGEDWEVERENFGFNYDTVKEAYSNVTGQKIQSSEEWYNTLTETYKLSIEKFSNIVKEYLDSKSPNHRIVFLVDEVGQFIGDNTQLMLNLQTIVENLGTVCGGKAWVIVTSQQNIDAVVGEVKASKANDFSKIQGRFTTRIALSSSNTDEVIKKRILDKKPNVRPILEEIYNKNRDIINNQISFSADNPTLPIYTDKNDFVDTYPFINYQFLILQKVFEAIRTHGATGKHLSQGERSMLDAFQISAIKLQEKLDAENIDESLGSLVPFSLFYNGIEGFLDAIVIRTINNAASNTSLDKFDEDLLKTLFMVRYIDLVKPNIENLATLCITNIDEDKILLRQKISESLRKLEKENLVKRNGELYYFMTNEEQDINSEIRQVEVLPHELTQEASTILFGNVLGNKTQHRYSFNNKDYQYNRIFDTQVRDNSAAENSIQVISPLNDDYESWNDFKCITETAGGSGKIVVKLPLDKRLSEELEQYKRVEKYSIKTNPNNQPASIQRIIQDVKHENRNRKERVKNIFSELFINAKFYIVGNEVKLKDVEDPAKKFAEAFDFLIDNTYNKLKFIVNYSKNFEADLKAILNPANISTLDLDANNPDGHANSKAFYEIQNNFLNLKFDASQKVTLKDVTERFVRHPWGWPQRETALLIAYLYRYKNIRLTYPGDDIPLNKAYEILVKAKNWINVIIHKIDIIDKFIIEKAGKITKDWLHAMPPTDPEKLEEYIRDRISDTIDILKPWVQEAKIKKYPTLESLKSNINMLEGINAKKSSLDFFNNFIEQQDDILDFAEDYTTYKSFHETQKVVYDQAKTFSSVKEANSTYYKQDPKETWQQLQQILQSKNPYPMIQKLKGYINSLSDYDSTLINKYREQHIEKADKLFDQLAKSAEEAEATNTDAVLLPLQEQIKKIKNSESIDAIIAAAGYVDKAFQKGEEILQLQLKKKAEFQPKDESIYTGDTPKPPKPPAFKPTIFVQAKSVSSKAVLETENDIDEYIESLKKKLLDAIQNGNKVKID